MIGQALQKAESRCCGHQLNSSLRPCFADKDIGPLVQCGGCERKQEVRLWCGICGRDAPAEAYVGYDAVGAVEKMNADNRKKIAQSIRNKFPPLLSIGISESKLRSRLREKEGIWIPKERPFDEDHSGS